MIKTNFKLLDVNSFDLRRESCLLLLESQMGSTTHHVLEPQGCSPRNAASSCKGLRPTVTLDGVKWEPEPEQWAWVHVGWESTLQWYMGSALQ